MDDVSKQGGIIKNIDADEDVVLEDAKDVAIDIVKDVQDADVEDSAHDQGRQAESQAKIYKINLDHANKVLSMQEEETEPAELQEVVDVVTTAKIITETEALARKNMMIYLKNVAGFKMDYFKGMSYDDIRLVFEKHFDSNVAFMQKSKEQMDEEDSRALKRLNESKEEKAAKNQKLDEEIITFTTTQLILLVERRYPLTRFTLDQMLNNVRLKVEEESEVSLELLSFGVDAAMDSKEKHAKCLMLLVKDLVLPSQDDAVD
nr:hypothetical protein [Tanacetum cinerariifolium]